MATTFDRSDWSVPSPGVTDSNRLDLIKAALEKAWARGWLDRPSIQPGALMQAARRVTGMHDFGGDDSWRDRLGHLCDSLEHEASLNALGRTIAHGQLVAALAGRLRMAALWRDHPEIARVRITAPIIVVGQMRSGSTRMQRLLACDERLTFTRFYESWNPLPRWNRLPFDDRKLRGWFALRVARALNPKFDVIHPVRSRQADEEIGLHSASLFGAAFEAQWRIPGFARLGEAMDTRPVYAEFRRYLQTIRWLRKNSEDKPWVLKLPQFSQDLDMVMQTFPDARLVVLHRDLSQVVGSSASLVHNQMVLQSDDVDRHWIGSEWLHKVRLREKRTHAARQIHAPPCVDVDFDAIKADWRGEMERVYAMLGLSLDRQTEARMRRFLASRRHRRLRRHHYDALDYGLSDERIAEAFAMTPHARALAAA